MNPAAGCVEPTDKVRESPDNPELGIPQVQGHARCMADVPIQFRPMPRPRPGTTPAPSPPAGPQRPNLGSAGKPSPRSTLIVDGMTCGNCARHVTEALEGVEGVALATVDLANATATVDWAQTASVRPDLLIRQVSKAGFKSRERVRQPFAKSTTEARTGNPWEWSIKAGLPAAAFLGIGDWLLGLGLNQTFQSISFLIAAGIVWVLGRRFYVGAWNQLRAGAASMDTLVSLGITAAMGYSIPALFSKAHGHLFFTETVTLLAFVGTGHYLEHRMSMKAGSALHSLLDLAPQTARRIDLSDVETEVPVAELNHEDQVVLRPGDRVPVDALVVHGSSAVDESMLTGESMPVDKAPGSLIYAGTVNRSGRIVANVSATGESTALARIADVIRRAQSTRAQVQRLADQISAVFVPIVVAIATFAALWWIFFPESAGAAHAFAESWLWQSHLPPSPIAAAVLVACAVLVIACPCAMGLATPVALMAGVNNAARRGILVRDAAVLETCGTIDTLIFDKTGTLTEGKPTVTRQADFRPSPAVSAPVPLPLTELAASLARRSTHPLSTAIASLAPGGADLDQFEEKPGAGLSARSNGLPLHLGSVAFLTRLGLNLAPAQPFIQAALAEGATPVLFAQDSAVIGAFALRDSVRPEARHVVQRLRDAGLRVGMLSGDHPDTAQRIAAEVGIDPTHVHAGVAPESKAGFLNALRASGHRVAFVGDGINDGPALAAADLGIAVARASDVAREAAGLVLLRSNLTAVPEALELARATLATIRQNLFWAFFYNAAAVPLAALGLVNPALCAAAMGLSDLIVVGNALRLSRRNIRQP